MYIKFPHGDGKGVLLKQAIAGAGSAEFSSIRRGRIAGYDRDRNHRTGARATSGEWRMADGRESSRN